MDDNSMQSDDLPLPSGLQSLRSRFINRRFVVLMLFLLSCWLIISCFSVYFIAHKRFDDDLRKQAAELEKTAVAVNFHFDRSLSYLYIVPENIADNEVVISALRTFAGQTGWQSASPESKRAFLNSRKGLMTLNRYLEKEKRDLGVDILWIVATNGDCIASSNYNKPESFIGINYTDRLYFKSAMAGKRGRQYAVGRATNIPGFFFSAPVKDGDEIVAVVVAKIDVSNLTQWFSRFNCFVTDESGVIVISSEKKLERYALEDAPVFRMSPQTREMQYKLRDLPVLKIGSHEGLPKTSLSATFPGSNDPYLLARNQQNKDGFTIFSYTKISEINQLHRIILLLTTLVFISGAALILLAAGIIRYLHDVRHSIAVAVQAQNELKSLNETLGDRIGEEVRISREKDNIMIQQDKMASIGQLAAGVAHEINNPIGFVSSNLVSLDKYLSRLTEFINLQAEKLAAIAPPGLSGEIEGKRKSLKLDYIMEDAGKLIQESLEGADRVRKIVKDLKTFSRLDEEQFKSSDINECLESTINIVWNEIKYKATLKKELGDIPHIKCYPQQLSQVVMNLLINASHAIENQGEIVLRSWGDTGFIYISVEDNGCGIPEEIRRKIFEPFFTTKEIGKGTGLGLSISFDIIRKHGGDITVDSVVGKGTKFMIRLTLAETPEKELAGSSMQN
jgi:C4-dicarboxylate-specific signal transduction histidine kinase